jgi:hypothetical protein
MEKIDAISVDDCTDYSVMEYLESTQERDAYVTAEYVKAEVLAKVSFAMSEKDPALRVMKEVADYYSLHRNLGLDFNNGKPTRPDQSSIGALGVAGLITNTRCSAALCGLPLMKSSFRFLSKEY